MSSALVFSIEEFSVFDGPGIRTTVFLMGCPLRCEWCHNPEGQSTTNSIIRSPNGCVKCGNCVKYATHDDSKTVFTQQSIDNCPNGLLRHCANQYTAEQLCAKLEQNVALLNASGGGVTFSGGEPTLNTTFLLDCLHLLDGKTNRAVQTCGYCPPTTFEQVLANCDYVLFDIKLVDTATHKKYTGVDNDVILHNFGTLAASGKQFVVRTPLIPTVTDTETNITNIAMLLSQNGVHYIELLPYNKMTGAKYPLIGKKYAPSFDETISVATREEIFAQYGVKAVTI